MTVGEARNGAAEAMAAIRAAVKKDGGDDKNIATTRYAI